MKLLLACMIQYLNDPGISPGSANQCILGKVCLRSNLSTNAIFVLQWNPVEKEWDCPCHGSCFDKKGKQLAGPATTDMRPPQIVTD